MLVPLTLQAECATGQTSRRQLVPGAHGAGPLTAQRARASNIWTCGRREPCQGEKASVQRKSGEHPGGGHHRDGKDRLRVGPARLCNSRGLAKGSGQWGHGPR